MSYWDWAVAAHGREGVDAALMDLQDQHGQCVAYLLWAAWAAVEGRELDPVLLAQAAMLAAHWEASATGSIRHARRELKTPAPPIDDDARNALREQVRKAEFAAERLLMDTLERLAPAPSGKAPGVAQGMIAAAAVWGKPAPSTALEDLAVRLG